MNCPQCGAELKPGANFCGKCGMIINTKPQPEAYERICPHCGCEIKPGMLFCGKCGARLSDEILTSHTPQRSSVPVQSRLPGWAKWVLVILAILGLVSTTIGIGGLVFKNTVRKNLREGLVYVFSVMPQLYSISGAPIDQAASSELVLLQNLVIDNLPTFEKICAAFLQNDTEKILENVNIIINQFNLIETQIGKGENIIEPLDISVKPALSNMISQLRTQIKDNYGESWFMCNILLYSLWFLIGGIVITILSVILLVVFGGKVSEILSIKMIPLFVLEFILILLVIIRVSNAISCSSLIINILYWPGKLLDTYSEVESFRLLFGY